MKRTSDTIENIYIVINDELDPVKGLLKRVLPNHFENFLLNLKKDDGKEKFSIGKNGNKVELSGTSKIAITSALNWYLKYICNAHISWSGNQLEIPEELILPATDIKQASNFEYRYYLNYCTFSYSMPWWDWERWEKEIDWMALNGINLPLAVIGQEAVWQNLLRKLDISEEEIFDFLPGPAYSAWNWLGNFDGWGGPTTQNWIDDQKELQLKILKRFREFDIPPVLQAFTGRVPKSFIKKYPDANIVQLPGWYGYEGVYFLDPSDPLFNKMSKMFIDEQTELYGNTHYYAGDVFHEIDSPSDSSDYLKRIYKGIQDGLLFADSKAKWVLQSWSIREDNIDILDEKHAIILDLYCDSEPKWKTTNAFHGHPWIWSIINNFGGRTGLGGKLELIANELPNAIKSADKGQLVGIGMAPEGIGNNPIIYDFITEMNWNSDIGSLENWVEKFSQRRYGINSENIKDAWIYLLQSVYSGPKNYPPVESKICAYPSLEIKSVSSNGSTNIYYDSKNVLEALKLLLVNKELIHNSDTYSYDIIDLSRQLSVGIADKLHNEIIDAYNKKNIFELEKLSAIFTKMSIDIDEILSNNELFCLSSWLNDAKKLAKDEEDRKLYEWNARRQITLWSSPEITEFHDYANKQWSGLIRDYYLPRWNTYFELMKESIENNNAIDEDKFKEKSLSWAVEWSNRTDDLYIENRNNEIELIERFVENYKSFIY